MGDIYILILIPFRLWHLAWSCIVYIILLVFLHDFEEATNICVFIVCYIRVMDQPWSYPEFPHPPTTTASSQTGRDDPSTVQSNPVEDSRNFVAPEGNPTEEANPYLWYPQTSWNINNPPFVSSYSSRQMMCLRLSFVMRT